MKSYYAINSGYERLIKKNLLICACVCICIYFPRNFSFCLFKLYKSDDYPACDNPVSHLPPDSTSSRNSNAIHVRKRRRDPLSRFFVCFEYRILRSILSVHGWMMSKHDDRSRSAFSTLTSSFNFCPLSTSFDVEESFDEKHDSTQNFLSRRIIRLVDKSVVQAVYKFILLISLWYF